MFIVPTILPKPTQRHRYMAISWRIHHKTLSTLNPQESTSLMHAEYNVCHRTRNRGNINLDSQTWDNFYEKYTDERPP